MFFTACSKYNLETGLDLYTWCLITSPTTWFLKGEELRYQAVTWLHVTSQHKTVRSHTEYLIWHAKTKQSHKTSQEKPTAHSFDTIIWKKWCHNCIHVSLNQTLLKLRRLKQYQQPRFSLKHLQIMHTPWFSNTAPTYVNLKKQQGGGQP